jgi:hypothetical protein
MRAIRTSIFALLVACGGGSEKPDAMIIIPPDAPPDAAPDAFEPVFDLSCVGNSQPAAAANVTLSGNALEVVIAGMQPDVQPAHNATIDVCPASSVACPMNERLDQQITPMNGCPTTGCTFTSASLATGGSPLDVYVKASKGTNLTTYIYPAAPVTANVMNIPAAMFSPGIIQALQLIMVVTQDPTKGIMLVNFTDCAGMPINDDANTTISVKQGGTAVQGTTELQAGSFDPSLAGTTIVFNVPAGDDQTPSAITEVGGTYKTTALRAHNVRVYRNATTATQVRPGF